MLSIVKYKCGANGIGLIFNHHGLKYLLINLKCHGGMSGIRINRASRLEGQLLNTRRSLDVCHDGMAGMGMPEAGAVAGHRRALVVNDLTVQSMVHIRLG